MVRRNYTKSNKITLVGWVDKTLNLTSIRQNVMSRFKGTRIWPFNPRVMDSKDQSRRMVKKIGKNILLKRSSST